MNLSSRLMCAIICNQKKGIIMRKSELIYRLIQEHGKQNIELTAASILRYLEQRLGNIGFPSNLSNINKLYILLENGYYPLMQKVLDSYDYDYGVELQHLLMNIAYGEANSDFESLRTFMHRFPSIHDIYRDDQKYYLDTRIGAISFEPLRRYSKDKKIRRFALQYETYGYCHVAALEFIKLNPDYRAVTSLIANQFGERHYHSYVETEDGYADFSNNIYMTNEDFNKVMRPKVLNSVTGNQLAEQEQELTSEDLPETKTLLLRLAVHNQIKGL